MLASARALSRCVRTCTLRVNRSRARAHDFLITDGISKDIFHSLLFLKECLVVLFGLVLTTSLENMTFVF